jgi:hypothetical protein
MRASWLARSFAVLGAAAVASVDCGETTRPQLDPRSELDPQIAAGTYVLEAVSGRGPVSGAFVLTGSGGAERRVQYAPPRGTGAREYVATGTFRLRAYSIDFALREDEGRSPYVWRPRGEWSAGRFNIRHPDPADGPDIVETYRRQ